MTGENPPSVLFDMPGLAPEQTYAVLGYRMGEVEKKVTTLLERFDGIAQYYVNTPTLMLALEPIKDRVKDLEDKDKERDTRKSNETAQFKLAITIAILSPILSIVIAILMGQSK